MSGSGGNDAVDNAFATEMTRRQLLVRAGVGFAGLSLVPLLSACGGGGQPTPTAASSSAAKGQFWSPPGGGKKVSSISWALFGDLVSADYAFAYDFNTNPVLTNVVESLLRIAPDGSLTPNLAESWEAVDPTTYVYKLRQGVKFHDGTEMTAEDAAASLSRLLDPKVGSYLSVFFVHVKSARATGKYEMTVKLTQPDALWAATPGTLVGGVTSKAFLEKNGKNVGKPAVGIMGTGAYRYVSWSPGQGAVIQAFGDYWNPQRQPKVGEITFKIITDEQTTIEALGTGTIDGAFNISGRNLKTLQSFGNVQIARGPSNFVHMLVMNCARKPFDDVRVRQAMSYAVDKMGMLQATWGGDGQLCKSPAPPATWGSAKDIYSSAYAKLPAFDQDMAKAKSLVEAAGATGAAVHIMVSTDHEKALGLAVQEAASKIGITVQLDSMPFQQLMAKIADTKRDYDAGIWEWSSDYPDPAGTLYQCFLSTSSVDYSNYKDASVDKALGAQLLTTDPAARAKLLCDAQAKIVEDQSWITFFTPNTNMPLNKRIGGYQLRPLWYWDSWAADLSGT